MRIIKFLIIIILFFSLSGFTMRYLGSLPISHSAGYSSPAFGAVGDINGDGLDDIFIRYPLAPSDSTAVFWGRHSWTDDITPDLWIQNSAYNTVLGDVNGDGIKDLILVNDSIKVFFGKHDFNGEINIEFRIPDFIGSMSFWSSVIGDFNGDGIEDLVFVANTWSNGCYIFLYLGKIVVGLVETPDKIIPFSLSSTGREHSNLCSGDFNGDGYDDVIISGGDSIFVYYGGVDMDTICDFSFGQLYETYPESIYIASSLTVVGDFNGDGIDDIGTWTLNYSRSDPYERYQIYIFLGSNEPDKDVDFIITRNLLSNSKTTGFFNHDGCKDIIADWLEDECLFKVFLGGSIVDNIYDFRILGTSNGSKSGDINGDGVDDIIVVELAYGGGPPADVQIWAGDTSMVLSVSDNNNSTFMQMGLNIYPNPFNDKVRIEIELLSDIDLKIEIYNELGQKVKTLGKGVMKKGRNTFVWDGKDTDGKGVSGGVYFLKVFGEGNVERKTKLVYLK